MSSRVFVIEECKVDISALSEHGEVNYVYAPNSGRSSMWSQHFRNETLRRLEDAGFDPKRDYVAVVGAVVITTIIVGALIDKYGKITALLYDAVKKTYRPTCLGSTKLNQESTSPC